MIDPICLSNGSAICPHWFTVTQYAVPINEMSAQNRPLIVTSERNDKKAKPLYYFVNSMYLTSILQVEETIQLLL